MSSRNDEKGDKATNLSNSPTPHKLNSKSIPYPSPPNSPPQTPGVSGDENSPSGAVYSSPHSPPTTPPRQSSTFTVHEKHPTEKRFNAVTLRTRLSLDNKRCGAPAKSKRPCGSWSPAANKTGVTSQLESMICLTQSSMELEAALDKLAKLVHCKNHDSGLPKKDRIEAWKKKFPVGEASATNSAILVEKRIRKALVLESTQCIGAVDNADSRCLLKVLETNMYCYQHINEQPLQKVASWKSSIVEILAEHLIKLAESGAPEEPVAPESPSTSRSDGLVLKSGSLSIPNFDRELSTYWPATYNTSPFEIIMKSNRLADYKSSYDMVKREMTRELHDKDQRDGHVYMYEVEGNPGFVKIGYTTRSVEERLQDWDFNCNRAPKALYPIPSSTAAAIPNARRVEALCHAELDHRKIRIYCHGCLKQHLEWFEIPSTEAIAVIQKWSNWMATHPYLSIQLRHKVKWTIREEETKRARDMDRLMREISGASG